MEDLEWLSGWALTHDYDPTWDYEVRFEQRYHPTVQKAQGLIEQISSEHPVPWQEGRVYPADLEGPLAVFVSGTNGAPVVLLDLDAHHSTGLEIGLNPDEIESAVLDSLIHELRHAYQEAHDWAMDETEAEHGSARIPF